MLWPLCQKGTLLSLHTGAFLCPSSPELAENPRSSKPPDPQSPSPLCCSFHLLSLIPEVFLVSRAGSTSLVHHMGSHTSYTMKPQSG